MVVTVQTGSPALAINLTDLDNRCCYCAGIRARVFRGAGRRVRPEAVWLHVPELLPRWTRWRGRVVGTENVIRSPEERDGVHKGHMCNNLSPTLFVGLMLLLYFVFHVQTFFFLLSKSEDESVYTKQNVKDHPASAQGRRHVVAEISVGCIPSSRRSNNALGSNDSASPSSPMWGESGHLHLKKKSNKICTQNNTSRAIKPAHKVSGKMLCIPRLRLPRTLQAV